MSHRHRVPALGLALALFAVSVFAQQADRSRALDEQIGRIFDSNEYQPPRFGPARWLPDGTAYTILERSAQRPGASDIVRYDAATGARMVLLAGSALIPEGLKEPLDIDDYAWSNDGQKLLIFTNTRRVWRLNTRGDYWVLDLASQRLRQLGAGALSSSLMFAKFSPDSSKVAYVRANNIYVEPALGGEPKPVTIDGSETTINGTSDWVYEEELGVRDGFRWSPDSAHIAYRQFDTTGVGSFSLLNNTDTLYPVVTLIPYPKVGTTNSAVRAGVVDVKTGTTRWMKRHGDPRDDYLARLEWVDEATVAIQQLNRLQNQHDVLLADVATGDTRSVFRDESKTWIDLENARWLDHGHAFLVFSERDGWQHVYRLARDGGEPMLVTRFEADVTALVAVDEPRGWLYFLASPGKAAQRYLYRSKLDGSGAVERVTPEEQAGTHGYDSAPNGSRAFHTYSRIDTPPAIDVVDLATHRSLRVVSDPSALMAKLAPLQSRPTEFFTVDIGDGVTLDGWMLKPPEFDATMKYPVIVFVYGEPANQTVLDRWNGNGTLFHRAVAEAGYIVLSVDNRVHPHRKVRRGERSSTVSSAISRRASRTRLSSRSPADTRSSIARALASGVGAAVAPTRSTRCFASPTRFTSVCQSRPCPISGSTTLSTRSVTWAFPVTTRRATGSAHRSTSRKASKASSSWFMARGTTTCMRKERSGW